MNFTPEQKARLDIDAAPVSAVREAKFERPPV